jgi:hypothetical protein
MAPYLRLRQICLVAHDLERNIAEIAAVLGLAVCHRDTGVQKYGLANALFAIGDGYLEIVAPTRPGTAAGRYLERRGGDGGYMAIFDCDDLERRGRHLDRLGIRIAHSVGYQTYQGLQLHPRDTGGCMIELNHTLGGDALDGPYYPAGPAGIRAPRSTLTTALRGAEIQGADAAALAARWGAALDRPVRPDAGVPVITLDLGYLAFTMADDGRGDGLGGVIVAVSDAAAICATAARRGHAVTGHTIVLCGTRFHLR